MSQLTNFERVSFLDLPTFLKIVVGRKITRRKSYNSKGKKKAWESTGWWECAQVIATIVCCPSLSPPPLPTTPSQQLTRSYLILHGLFMLLLLTPWDIAHLIALATLFDLL
jgi:hypothetical protein